MNDYDAIAELYDAYVTDTRDHGYWERCAARADGPILELTAGTGRATIALARAAAHPVVGLDLSRGMLRRLRRRCAGSATPIHAVGGDLTALPVRPDRFALAVIPFNSLGELVDRPDRAAAVSEIARALRPNGLAVVTLHNPARRRLTLDGELRRLGPFTLDDRRLEVLVQGRPDGEDRALSRQTYRMLNPSGRVLEERRAEIRFALPGESEVRELADLAGLDLVALLGDYDGSPYDERQSPFLIAELRRRPIPGS